MESDAAGRANVRIARSSTIHQVEVKGISFLIISRAFVEIYSPLLYILRFFDPLLLKAITSYP